MLDEVHRIKDARSSLSGAVALLKSRKRFGLTGTLLQVLLCWFLLVLGSAFGTEACLDGCACTALEQRQNG